MRAAGRVVFIRRQPPCLVAMESGAFDEIELQYGSYADRVELTFAGIETLFLLAVTLSSRV